METKTNPATATEYRALARRLIPHHDGGNGHTMGDWILHGVFDSLREAENALSGCRARGEQTRIVEAGRHGA